MSPKEFYEKQRRLGYTDKITCNPEPNYNEDFYQEIFSLMKNYAQEEQGKKTRPIFLTS